MALKYKRISLLPIRALLFAALLGILMQAPQQAHAQATACDPEYMDALEARAWLEMQRELLQNQNIITKPDSVLEYSCFTNDLWNLVNYNQPGGDPDTWLFSEGGCCNTPNVDPSALDRVVGTLVYAATEYWILQHFWVKQNNDDALGGRAPGTTSKDNWNYGDGLGDDKNYLCTNMSAVWDIAHCDYFSSQNPTEGFYDFAYYAGQDPRVLPQITAAGQNPFVPTNGPYCPKKSGTTEALSEQVKNMFGKISPNQQTVAFNGKQNYYVTSENPEGGSVAQPTHRDPYKQDAVNTHLDLILPIGMHPAPDSCSDVKPILTGVCVTRIKSGSEVSYADAVCPNPGCHYGADISCGATSGSSGHCE